jgi:flagella basal body P-ring formation protein FlgA
VARRANGVTEGACAADVPSTTFGGSAPPLRRGGEGRCIGQRLRGLIFALALVGAPAIAWAGQPVELKLHPVARGYITLGDLFENANETAAKVVVVHAPPAGLDAVLEATEIQMLARREGLDWSNQQGLLHITVASLPSGAPSSHSSSARTGERSARRARSGEGELTRTLVYARNLAAGEIVDASDLQWSSATVAGGDSLDNPALAIGKSARHPVHAGAPVQPYDLVSPKLIHAGDSVEVAYENDGIVLTLEGKAASDATLGDTVEVINTSSKKTIEAVASAPGRAVVGPAADVLKASMLSPTLHTAALN